MNNLLTILSVSLCAVALGLAVVLRWQAAAMVRESRMKIAKARDIAGAAEAVRAAAWGHWVHSQNCLRVAREHEAEAVRIRRGF